MLGASLRLSYVYSPELQQLVSPTHVFRTIQQTGHIGAQAREIKGRLPAYTADRLEPLAWAQLETARHSSQQSLTTSTWAARSRLLDAPTITAWPCSLSHDRPMQALPYQRTSRFTTTRTPRDLFPNSAPWSQQRPSGSSSQL